MERYKQITFDFKANYDFSSPLFIVYLIFQHQYLHLKLPTEKLPGQKIKLQGKRMRIEPLLSF